MGGAACAQASRAVAPPQATSSWHEVQDLHVQEALPQLVSVSESYILVYERKDAKP